MSNVPDPNFRFTPEEKARMKALMMAALERDKRKPKPQPPTAAQKAEARFDESKKPIEAILQDVTAAAEAVTRRFSKPKTAAEADEQDRLRREAEIAAFEAEQEKWATDGAQSRNMMHAYRRAAGAVPEPHQRYQSMCEAEMALRDAAAAVRNSRISCHKSPLDPDWDL
jgi:hypothetical protein